MKLNSGNKMGPVFENNKRSEHPVDLIEKVAYGHDWTFERTTEDEISVCIEGVFATYDIFFSWIEDQEALHIACAFRIQAPEKRRNELYHLLVQINSKMLMGHFDYWRSAEMIMYRQTLLLAGGLYPSDEQVELLLVNALEACESHHQAFEMVLNSKTCATKALHYALFETVGNA